MKDQRIVSKWITNITIRLLEQSHILWVSICHTKKQKDNTYFFSFNKIILENFISLHYYLDYLKKNDNFILLIICNVDLVSKLLLKWYVGNRILSFSPLGD